MQRCCFLPRMHRHTQSHTNAHTNAQARAKSLEADAEAALSKLTATQTETDSRMIQFREQMNAARSEITNLEGALMAARNQAATATSNNDGELRQVGGVLCYGGVLLGTFFAIAHTLPQTRLLLPVVCPQLHPLFVIARFHRHAPTR